MWWIIALGALAVVAFLFAKFRAISHQVQLANAARSHIYTSFRTFNIAERELDPRLWDDPYLLGYAQGSVAIMTAVYGPKLSTIQKGMVLVRALQALVPERSREIGDRMADLFEQRDLRFMLGMQHGTNVALLAANRPSEELLADPDVQQALREAPATRRLMEPMFGAPSGPYVSASASLMLAYLSDHKLMEGY